jgi:ATP-dependent protease ClpP protease subunit
VNSRASLAWAIEAAAKPTEQNLYLFDIIGDPYDGVTSGQFVKQLASVKANTINLIIDSPGGSVDDALAMFNALKAHPATINGFVIGGAHSAASFVFQAADKRNVAPQAALTIHEAHAPVMGNAKDMRAAADLMDAASQAIAQIYQERGGGTVEAWRELMQANGGTLGSTFVGQEAVAVGLADAVSLPTFNYTPLKLVAQRVATPEASPIELDLSLIPSLASGYQKPIPNDFTRLLEANLKGVA